MEKDKSTAETQVDNPLMASFINVLARLCRAEADKWYHDPITGELLQLNHGERFALMHSELSEAFEAVRKDKMDDHLPNRPGVTAELADALIRILDYCGDNDLDIGGTFVEKVLYNRARQDHTNEARLAPGGKKF
jgi:NTP pyrophosphatase (non-canonical NTP hydrolase)